MKILAIAAAASMMMLASATANEIGKASYYWQGQRTANGERFNPNAMTAAHRKYPFGSMVRVTNLHNNRSVVLRINDRGPFVRGRIIDVSKAAAYQLAMTRSGVIRVRVERVS